MVNSSGDRPCGGGQAATIRIPVHVVEKLNKIARAERQVTSGLGRDPTADELADLTGIQADEVESIKHSAQIPVWLEKPVDDEQGSELGDFIADDRAQSPYDHVADILTQDALRRALDRLSYALAVQ